MQWGRSGEPISLLDWVLNIGEENYRRVAFTEIESVKITTTWHGIPQGFDAEARPFIFETAVYRHGRLARTRRYASEPEALCGHEEECSAAVWAARTDSL